jgi:hypothetical protein
LSLGSPNIFKIVLKFLFNSASSGLVGYLEPYMDPH